MRLGGEELLLNGFDLEQVHYPLDIRAHLNTFSLDDRLWTTSIQTLVNCMHDCYEDCPFYEQLQYAMDVRSSALFTYLVSGDDRLAKQALTQLHNSFQANIGLLSSRAPTHNFQLIPNFSLFWICMLRDHLEFFNDAAFLAKFAPVVDAVLGYFSARIGRFGLVESEFGPGIWNFTDWAESWRPYGIPPLVERTGISTYTNALYAYALRNAAFIVKALGRPSLAKEYIGRAEGVAVALQEHCFDGELFADSLAGSADKATDYSQHGQVWAVLSGAVGGEAAQTLLRKALSPDSGRSLVPTSISMSFYTLRALSMAGGTVYEDHFHQFWNPWRAQLALNVTTWEEDNVSQRSDCHAWGSAPIHEFMVEVAGIQPAEPGWTAIKFQPRLGLYRRLRASFPVGKSGGALLGIVHVSWEPGRDSGMQVSLQFEPKVNIVMPVHVRLPSRDESFADSSKLISLWVGAGESHAEDDVKK